MFQRRYVGEEEWKRITKELVKARLSDWYQEINEILNDMKSLGVTYRTPFAEYRWIEDETP